MPDIVPNVPWGLNGDMRVAEIVDQAGEASAGDWTKSGRQWSAAASFAAIRGAEREIAHMGPNKKSCKVKPI
jgi:hypothetical protein